MFLIEYTTTLNPDTPVVQILETEAARSYWFGEYLTTLQSVYGNDFITLIKDMEIDLTTLENLDDLSSFALAKKDLVVEHLIIRDEINSSMTSSEYDLIESHITENDLDPQFDEDEEVVAEVHDYHPKSTVNAL